MTAPKENFPYSAKKLVRFFPREFTIVPGQSQVIRVMARIPADTPDGQYHVHIKFFEDAQEQGAPPQGAGASIHAPLAYSTLLPITVSKGNIDTKIGWTDQSLTKGKAPGTYHFSTKLSRSGNGQGNAYFDVMYVPASGGKPVQIGNRRTSYIYRELDALDFHYDFPLPEGVPPSGQIKFILLSGDSANPTLVDEKSFAIP
jgi:hypothetical protein